MRPAAITSRLRSLDALRGLAALAVVVYHYGNRAPELYPDLGRQIGWVSPGSYGVQLFFVISGFVIFMTLQRSTARRYLITRFVRLYPTYWVCLTIIAATVAVFGLPGREVSGAAVAVNYTMIQEFLEVPDVDGAHWTLAAELGFYLQVGVLFFTGCLTGRRLVPSLYVWLAAATVYSAAATADGAGIQFVLAPALVWIPLFIAGIALFLRWAGDHRLAVLALPPLAALSMVARGPGDGVAALVVVGIVAAALWAPLELPTIAGRPLLFLGAISYPLYLLHQNLGYIALRELHDVGVSQLAAAILTLTGMVLFAALVARVIDDPVRRDLRARLKIDPPTGKKVA